MSISDAARNAEILGLDPNPLIISGDRIPGSILTATYKPNYAGSGLQWYGRSGSTLTDFAGETTSTYTVKKADRAYDEIGCKAIGAVYLSSAGKIPVTAPGAPVIGSPIVGNKQATFNFSPPADDGGSAISQFYLHVFKKADDSPVGLPVVGAASPLVKSGLDNDVQYYGKVLAENAFGKGPFSAASTLVTPVSATPMIAASRLAVPVGLGIIATAGTVYQGDKIGFMAPQDWDVEDPSFYFPGFFVNGVNNEQANSNDIPIRNCALHLSSGQVIPITFSGSASGTVTAGSWLKGSTPPGTKIPRNTRYWVVTQTVLTSGQYRLTYYYLQDFDGSSTSGVSNRDAFVNGTSAFAVPTPGVTAYGPCLIVGNGWVPGKKPCVVGFGDSILAGDNDWYNFVAPDGVFGYVGRGMNDPSGAVGRLMFANFAGPGTRIEGLNDTGCARRKAMLLDAGKPFTSILCQMGINTTPTARITNWETIAGPWLRDLAGSKKIVGVTTIPQNGMLNSTKGTNQADLTLVAPGDWRPYQLGTFGTRKFFDDMIDCRSAFEGTPGSGIFPVPSFRTTLAAALDGTSKNSFVTNAKPDVGAALIINPGPSSYGAKYVFAVVDNGNGTFTVSFQYNFSATFPAGTVVAETNTEDGTHPKKKISELGAVAFAAQKNAGVFA